MRINRATDYAVRVMVHLAAVPSGQKVPLSTLAEVTDVRQSFLSKILQQLVRQGLVTSYAGTGGGFCLNVDPAAVSLLQVIEAMEGPLQLNVCLASGRSCERKPSCPVHPVWRRAQAAITNVLGGVTLAELAKEIAGALPPKGTALVGLEA
jgi:Rrf2 family protein